jgi:hypothetical protein
MRIFRQLNIIDSPLAEEFLCFQTVQIASPANPGCGFHSISVALFSLLRLLLFVHGHHLRTLSLSPRMGQKIYRNLLER